MALMASLDRALTTHRDVLRDEHGELHLLHGPLDVVLFEDSVVQPEILVCTSAQVTPERIMGAPRLVIEVIAPLTALYDRREKLDLYENAGVREYLIVDPQQRFAEHYLGKGSRYVRTLLGEEDSLDMLGVRVLDHLALILPDECAKGTSPAKQSRATPPGRIPADVFEKVLASTAQAFPHLKPRDPARIPAVLEVLRDVWSPHPDLRLAQLIVNAAAKARPGTDVFFVEDEDLLIGMRSLGKA